MPHFAVAYGDAVRFAKSNTAREAAIECYGVAIATKMSVIKLSSNPKYLSQKALRAELDILAEKHKDKL